MKVLSNGNGCFLLENQTAEDEAMEFYQKNGMEFDDLGTGIKSCGDDYLYENAEEIEYDEETMTQHIKISYLTHEGGARYSNTEMVGEFVSGELVSCWEER